MMKYRPTNINFIPKNNTIFNEKQDDNSKEITNTNDGKKAKDSQEIKDSIEIKDNTGIKEGNGTKNSKKLPPSPIEEDSLLDELIGDKTILNNDRNPTFGNEPLTENKEPSLVKRNVFKSEEKMALNNEVQYLREQLSHSENQLSTLEFRLKESNDKINLLEDELKNYEMYQADLNNVSQLTTNIRKLTKENEDLKVQLSEQKEHIQMLYFILLVSAVL